MIEYFKQSRLSQSELKKYLKNPRYIRTEPGDLYENEDHHFTKGSLVDLLVTDPKADDIIRDYYYLNRVVDISDTLKSIVRRAYHITNSMRLESVDPNVLQSVCNEHEYYMNRFKEGEEAKYDWRVKKILDDNGCQDYLQTLFQSKGKILINAEDLEKASLMANAIFSNKFTAPFFELETIYQKAIYTDIAGYPSKGLLDIMFVDHSKKIVYITDIKSTADYIGGLFRGIWKYRYDIQGGWYRELVINSGEYEGYTIEFNIFATSFNEPNITEIFHFPSEVLDLSKHGNPEKYRTGWLELIDRYEYHQNNGFEYSLDYIKNGGRYIVND